MRSLALTMVSTAAMMLAGCNVTASGEASVDTGADTETAAADPAPAAPAPAAPAPAATPAPAGAAWQRITITGFECGDNCYVQYRTAAGQEDSAMCETPLCNSWYEVQAMPDSEKGKSYEVQMGTTDQVDGEGAVMESDFPAIIAMRPVS